jgi:alpha-L-rhamnosidase
MTSFNHYALGAVADWLHRRVAGLAPAAPGYRRIEVRPLANERLTRAASRHLTPYGEAAVAWERAEGRLRLSATVPVGTTATVHVPGQTDPVEVAHGTHEWTVDDPCADTPALPAEPTVRQFMDHEPSWSAFAAAAAQTGVAEDDGVLAARLERYLDAPAAELADLVGGRRIAGTDALRAHLDTLLDNN